MPSVEDTAYPRLKSNPSPEALETLYRPTDEEVALAGRTARGEVAKVGFLVLLKTFQVVGYPVQIAQVPSAIIRQVAKTLKSELSPADVAGYDESGTRRRHVSLIRQHLAVKSFGPEAQQIVVTAMEIAVETQHDLVDLLNVALEELVRARFELPGFTTLVQMARDTRAHSNETLYQQVSDTLADAAKMQLNQLFYCPDGELTTPWNEVKQEPGRPKLSELQSLVDRLNWLKPLQAGSAALANISDVKREHFAAEARTLDAGSMKEVTDRKRYMLAVALLQQRYCQTLDDIADVFVKRVRGMHYKAKDALENYRAESQQRTDELIATLRQVAIAHSTDGDIPDRFAAVDCVIGEQAQQLIAQCDDHLAYAGNNYLPFLPKFYRSHRAVLFRFLAVVPLHPSTQDDSLTQAIQFIQAHRGARKTWLPLAAAETSTEDVEIPSAKLDLGWVPPKWWELVTGEKSRATVPTQVHRQYFELCVFSYVLLGLKSGDLYIEGSAAFGDYLAQLLSWPEVEAHLADYAEQMGFPTDPKAFVRHLKDWLAAQIEQTDQGCDLNMMLYSQEKGESVKLYFIGV